MTGTAALSAEEERFRPLYARVLRLRHVDPGGVLCFVYFEGVLSLGLLLALAELVSWWEVPLLPVAVAGMVKANDLVAAAVARSAARVPAQERDRFRREMQPAVGRASVPRPSLVGLGAETPTAARTGVTGPGDGPPSRQVQRRAADQAKVVTSRPAPAGEPGSAHGPVSGSGVVGCPVERDGVSAPAPGRGAVAVRSAWSGGQLARSGRRAAESGRGTGSGWRTGSGRRPSRPGWTGGLGSGMWEVGGRLVARLVPAGRPLSMTAMVRARLAAGARPRLEPELEPRPDLGLVERLRSGAPGPSLLVTHRAAPVRYHPSRGVAARPAEGPAEVGVPAAGWPAASGSSGRPTGPSSGAGDGRPVNDRWGERSVRRWDVPSDPADRVRQSATRRYERRRG